MIQSLSQLRQQFLVRPSRPDEFPEDDPRRLHSLSLEQQKKRAKDLLKALRAGDGWQRVQTIPALSETVSPDTVKLADAQWVIARENGFYSWPKMKRHIETEESARAMIASGRTEASDCDRRTLHIRCGNDIMQKLAVAGFEGDFLSFADPYIQGPVPAMDDLDEFIRIRAEFISSDHVGSLQQVVADLSGDYYALEQTRHYERVCFWFERDAYDVLAFIKLLHYFSEPGRRAPDMRYVCLGGYPGVERFNGIGQLPPETFPVLWEQFQPISEAQFDFGMACWDAYTDSTPLALSALSRMDDSPLAEIMPALRRHLRELPWHADGLSLSERLTLKILHEQGPQSAVWLFFHWYTIVYEPLVFMGDVSYWQMLRDLAEATRPAIKLKKQSPKPKDWEVSLTDFGRDLLADRSHWLEHNAFDRWFGGTHNQTGGGIWCWDDDAKRVVNRGS